MKLKLHFLRTRWFLFLAGTLTSAALLTVVWGVRQLTTVNQAPLQSSSQKNGLPLQATPAPNNSNGAIAPALPAPLTPENGGIPATLIPNPPLPSPLPSGSDTADTDPANPPSTLPSPQLGTAKAIPVLSPSYVTFPEKSNRAELSGSLDSLLTQPFLVSGRIGQALMVASESPGVAINIFDPDGLALGSTTVSTDRRWAGSLVKTGSYRIEVSVETSGPYKLSVQLIDPSQN